MRFSFVHAEKAHYPVSVLCRLFGVTRQGYYQYVQRAEGARARADLSLSHRILTIHRDSYESYGTTRLHRQLHRDGVCVGRRRVERLVRSLGLNLRAPRRAPGGPQMAFLSDPTANILNRDFAASRPNQRWVTDITYIPTNEGWCYLAAVIDLYSRAVVGWAIDASADAQLALRALDMALKRRSPSSDLLHHSDRGCQYTSSEYQRRLAEHGVTVSWSRKGNCWDNAVAESFFATLKKDLVYKRRWATRNEVRREVFSYIEIFYNRRRLHSTLKYRTPIEIEADYDRVAA